IQSQKRRILRAIARSIVQFTAIFFARRAISIFLHKITVLPDFYIAKLQITAKNCKSTVIHCTPTAFYCKKRDRSASICPFLKNFCNFPAAKNSFFDTGISPRAA
ncbi:MAG: hypothetical protein NC299_12150, partial [Lachnospiraceae bacterium]|nr:hypothetical protein [Lachnospiraceae bacterium]